MKKPIINLVNYRKESRPPKAGEPIITASVTIIPKTTPTRIKRLFMPKILSSQLKTDCLDKGQIWKNVLMEKLQF